MTGFREHVVGTIVENIVHGFLPAPLPWKSSSTCGTGRMVKVNLDVTGFVKKFEGRTAIRRLGPPSFDQVPGLTVEDAGQEPLFSLGRPELRWLRDSLVIDHTESRDRQTHE